MLNCGPRRGISMSERASSRSVKKMTIMRMGEFDERGCFCSVFSNAPKTSDERASVMSSFDRSGMVEGRRFWSRNQSSDRCHVKYADMVRSLSNGHNAEITLIRRYR